MLSGMQNSEILNVISLDLFFRKLGERDRATGQDHVLAAWARMDSISCTENDNINMFARMNESFTL
jgi:hypothetical protein